MISLEAARELIAQEVQPLEAVRLPLAQACGRVLREDVIAAEDFPAFDRSAMDGYAVLSGDDSERFRIVAEIQPGTATPGVPLQRGECARIFTGAAVPAGAGQVIMQEDTRREGEFMVRTRSNPTTHIRRRGEDARLGAILLAAGARLGPAETALLAFAGYTAPAVAPAVRAVHFTTGNELVAPDSTPAPGQIRDSNSTLVAALLAGCGTELFHQARCRDSLESLVGAVAEIGASWDLLLISGGASVGDYDFGARALERLGFTLHFRKINLRPGKPLIFATRQRQVAFVIPGNPVSHLVTFHVAIAHALDCLADAGRSWPLFSVRLDREIPADARETWWPARLSCAGGELSAHPLPWQSSGDAVGIAGTNGLLRLAAGVEPYPAGALVPALLVGTLTVE